MKHDVQQENELRRYLLGELPLEEQVLVKERLFFDSDYGELLQVVEDDLIDDYLANELKGDERERFVNHFLLEPEHGADFRIAQALKKHLSTDSNPSPAPADAKKDDPAIIPASFFSKPFVWLSLTVAALIVFSIIAWVIFRAARGPASEAPQQAHDPQPANTLPNERQPSPLPKNDNRVETVDKGNTNESGTRPENSNKPPERQYLATKIESYKLTAGDPSRSPSSTNKVTIYEDTKEVHLELPLEFAERFEKYRAELFRGVRKIAEFPLTPDANQSSSVSVTIPADVLRQQKHKIKLYGIPTGKQIAEPHVPYHFAVERKSTAHDSNEERD